jgi:glycosyltransferase involved in cell wall biosynthesis
MKWAILLGSPDISGGTYVIFEHALRAMESGIDVHIIMEEELNLNRIDWHPEAKKLNWKTYENIANVNFDVCIATWWRTVYEIPRVSANNYIYFVQSIESKFYDSTLDTIIKLVDSTYMLKINIITEAKWIKEYLKANYGIDAYLVPNGIRKDIYKSEGRALERKNDGKLRVLVEGPINVPFKNVSKSIELCIRASVDEIWLLTSSQISSYPGVDRVFSRVPIFKTPEIYRSCDVILKLSYVEGMFGPPLEMFHCGGTSITYDVTGHDEYIVNQVNGLVSAKDDDVSIIENIKLLKNNREKLVELKGNALKTALAWPDWDESSKLFIAAIHEILSKENLSIKDDLFRSIKFYFEWYVLAENKNITKNTIQMDKFISKLKMRLSIKHPRIYDKLRFLKFKYLMGKGIKK